MKEIVTNRSCLDARFVAGELLRLLLAPVPAPAPTLEESRALWKFFDPQSAQVLILDLEQ